MSEIIDFIVRGGSMAPGLNDGDNVHIELCEAISRYEIIVYKTGADGQSIKFCVGIPDDPISLKGNTLTVGGVEISLTNEAMIYCWNDWIKFNQGKIPENCIFALGAVPESIDSKQLGYIFTDNIIGKLVNK